MMFSLFVVLASLASICSATEFSVEPLRNAASRQVFKEIDARVKAAFAARKPATLRKTLADYATGGFLAMTSASDSKCNTVTYSAGFPVNVCTVGDNAAYKIMFSADTDNCDGGIIEYFSDKECTESIGTSDLTDGDFSCKESESLFDPEEKSYTKFSCSKYAAPTFSVASGVTETYYNSTDCASEDFQLYVAFTENTCLDYGNGVAVQVACGDEGQLKWDFFEGGSKCEGEALGQVLYTEECALGEPELSSDDDDDAAITDDRHVFNPPPSVSTTPFPTSAPVNVTMSNRYYCAAASKKVTLKASQTVNGFSIDTYNEDSDLYDMTFKQAIAGTMTGVTADDVTGLTVKAGPTSARQSARALTSDSVTLSYTVSLVTSTSADALSAQLSAAVEDGTFNTLLHEYAAENGATALSTATSDSVDVTVVNDSDGKKHSITKGGIAGIVVGGFVGLCLFAMIAVVYMRLRQPSSAAEASHAAPAAAVELTEKA